VNDTCKACGMYKIITNGKLCAPCFSDAVSQNVRKMLERQEIKLVTKFFNPYER